MKKKSIIAVLLLAALFASSAFAGLSGAFAETEIAVHSFINPSGSAGGVFKLFTDIGEAYGVIAVIAIFLLLPPTRRRIGAPLAVSVTVTFLASKLIKQLVSRQRPLERLLEVGGYSFPSGHAMNNAALYIGIMLLSLRLCKSRAAKAAVIAACLFMTFMIGASRVYFNVHYLTDVVCGWCLGGIAAVISSAIFFNISEKRGSENE